jgi:hypothetical protein
MSGRRDWVSSARALNGKPPFVSHTPLSSLLSSKFLRKCRRVCDFTGYNNKILLSVPDEVKEWMIGSKLQQS